MRWGPRLPVVCALVVIAAAAFGQGRDTRGRPFRLFEPAAKANVAFFVQTDCPISNSYAPEIQRICKAYASKGVSCALVYEDVKVSPDAVSRHMTEYGYTGVTAAIDSSRAIADRARATITPEAVVVDSRGAIRYRGRIDNFYAALGKPRQHVTEHDLVDALDAVLAGRPVPTSETDALGCFIARPQGR